MTATAERHRRACTPIALVVLVLATLGMATGVLIVPPAAAVPGVDLTISSLFVTLTATGVIATETTSNIGDLTAPATTTRFYLSSDTVLDATTDLLLGSRGVPDLPGGTSSSVATPLAIPTTIPAGIYFIIAKTDPDGDIAEFDENNNTKVTLDPIRIEGDLVVALDVRDGSGTPAAGADIRVGDSTKNEAAVPVPASTTDLYLSLTPTFDARSATLLGSRVVPALGPGETSRVETTVTLPAGLTGTRYLFAKANAGNSVVESNASNNVSTAKAITIGADLIVLSLDVPGSVANAAAGDTITVVDSTKSNNSAPAGASTTKFYLITGTTLDGSAVLLGSRTVPALDAGQTHTMATPLILPATAVGTTFRIIAKADAGYAVAEINEDNNVSTPSFAFTLGPDLRVLSLDIPGIFAAVPAGITIPVTNSAKNEGGTEVGPSIMRFYLSVDANLGPGDILLGSRPVPKLTAGQTHTVETPLTLPTGIAGKYRVIAEADADKQHAETNEANNIGVYSSIAIGPDLLVEGMTIPARIRPGTNFVVRDTTKNKGAGTASESTTSFYLSKDDVLDAGDILLGSRATPPLSAGAKSTLAPQNIPPVVIPDTTRGGTHFIIAVADTGHVVAESEEGNNAFARAIEIQKVERPRVHPLPDFDGDGEADVLWRHSSGSVAIWLMHDASIAAADSPGSPTLDWTIEGMGDFNGDGQTDILWRHERGQIAIWLMDGTGIAAADSPTGPGLELTVQAVGDFDGDGKADILWRDEAGGITIWLMDGTSVTSVATLDGPNLEWTIEGTGDFDGDGKADILWRHAGGLVAIWLMDGASLASADSPAHPGLDWTIQGIGDFNGDGKADILWRHAGGQIAIWLMDGTSIAGANSPASPSLDLTVQGVGDLDGDGRADILWRDFSGVVKIWLMDGTEILGTITSENVELDWSIE